MRTPRFVGERRHAGPDQDLAHGQLPFHGPVRGPLIFGSRRIVFSYFFKRRAGTFRVAWLFDGMIYVYVSERSETL
jgi:hypothetical protein